MQRIVGQAGRVRKCAGSNPLEATARGRLPLLVAPRLRDRKSRRAAATGPAGGF